MPLSKQLKKKAIKSEVQTAMVDKGVLSLVTPDPVTLSKEKSASELRIEMHCLQVRKSELTQEASLSKKP